MTDDDSKPDPDPRGRGRRKLFHYIGRTAGKQFRKNGSGREVAKRVGSAVIRRGLWRFLRYPAHSWLSNVGEAGM